jgi:formylglycine-generating enzyme required for sulfatase activity
VSHWIRCTLFTVTLLMSMGAAWGQAANQLFFEGFELLKDGKATEAIAKFEQGLKAEPNNAMARYYLGEAYFAAGQKDKAREQLRKSLDLDANSQIAGEARKRLAELSGNAFAGGGAGSFPDAGTLIRECPQCPEMVVVPSGQFIMGSPPSETGRQDDEGPPHLVTIAKPFAVGKYEVTFREWEACVADRACAQAKDEGYGRDRRPVIHVNYEQAVGYAEWLSEKTGRKYRLLSEAEWEYAARAGSDKARFWGSGTDRACQFANVYDTTGKAKREYPWENFGCDDGYAVTAPAGSFKPNAFGLYDMLGNVSEWVEDCWNQSYAGAPADGRVWASGDCSRRVSRGGSWYSTPALVRSAKRDRYEPSARNDNLGFRVARTLP